MLWTSPVSSNESTLARCAVCLMLELGAIVLRPYNYRDANSG